MARFTSGQGTTSSMPSMARVGSSYGNLKREVMWTPPPPSDLMARFTSGHGTTSSMPSMARVGSSYGNLKREVCDSSPAIGSDGTVYVGSMTKSSMPSMARVGSSYGNLKREWCVHSSPAIGSDGTVLRRVIGQQALCHQWPGLGSSYGNLKTGRDVKLLPRHRFRWHSFTFGSNGQKSCMPSRPTPKASPKARGPCVGRMRGIRAVQISKLTIRTVSRIASKE